MYILTNSYANNVQKFADLQLVEVVNFPNCAWSYLVFYNCCLMLLILKSL